MYTLHQLIVIGIFPKAPYPIEIMHVHKRNVLETGSEMEPPFLCRFKKFYTYHTNV